jgi:hypothetical protein
MKLEGGDRAGPAAPRPWRAPRHLKLLARPRTPLLTPGRRPPLVHGSSGATRSAHTWPPPGTKRFEQISRTRTPRWEGVAGGDGLKAAELDLCWTGCARECASLPRLLACVVCVSCALIPRAFRGCLFVCDNSVLPARVRTILPRVCKHSWTWHSRILVCFPMAYVAP